MSKILHVVLLISFSSLLFAGSARSYYQKVKWHDRNICYFVLNHENQNTTTTRAFIVNAELVGTTSKILTTDEGQAISNPSTYQWAPTTSLFMKKIDYDASGEIYVVTFVQLGTFETQWVPGQTVRMSVTLIDNGLTTSWDKVIPSGTYVIWNNTTTPDAYEYVPEYSLEHLGPEHFFPTNPISQSQGTIIDNSNSSIHIVTGPDRISGVPNYKWSFGCAPTAIASLLGYYDRTYLTDFGELFHSENATYENNIAPQSSIWGAYAPHNFKNPLSASMIGLNGRTIKGHVDDYWWDLNSHLDPYINSPYPFMEHEKDDPIEGRCIADYIGTNQHENFNNYDGGTHLVIKDSGERTEWNYLPNNFVGTNTIQGGIRQYISDCGYSNNLFNCYFQKRANFSLKDNPTQAELNNGITWEEFKAAIDANQPVLLSLVANTYDINTVSPNSSVSPLVRMKYHLACAYAYSESDNMQIVYFYDTSQDDFLTPEMQWTGTYSYAGFDYLIFGLGIVDLRVSVGIEDGVNIIGNGVPLYGTSETYQTVFHDEEPYGNIIQSARDFFYVYHSEGKLLLSSETYEMVGPPPPNYHIQNIYFEINTPQNLPLNYQWVRNPDGTIKAELMVALRESNNYDNWALKDLKLAYPPDCPQITSISQVDEELHLNISNRGATSYKVYYDTDTGVPYSGTGALEGPSPITFNAYGDIKLTGLTTGTTWHIAVKGINNAGESHISADHTYIPLFTDNLVESSVIWNHDLTLSHPIAITSIGNLCISQGVTISLVDDGSITCESNGSMQIGNQAVITGLKCTQYVGESNPVEIPGNYVKVNGSITIGSNVSFESYDGNTWDGLIIENTSTNNISNCTFSNCGLQKINGSMYIANTTFDKVYIQSFNAGFSMSSCNGSMSLYCSGSPLVTVENTHFTGEGHGIELDDCQCYIIDDCQIYDKTGNGIIITECNNNQSGSCIAKCDITNNTGDGIRFYHSLGTVIDCNISGNSKGIVAFRGSNVRVMRDTSNDPWVNVSEINNNRYHEILYMNDCNLLLNGGENRIVDNTFELGNFDQYLVACPNLTPQYSPRFKHNYWGYEDGQYQQLIPPANRFFPSILNPSPSDAGYFVDPVWGPGFPHTIDKTNDELVYDSAIDQAIAGNAVVAIDTFKELISQYPYSLYAKAAQMNIYALETDKQALMDYYQTEPNLHWNGEIDKITDYLINWCNIKIGNYSEAIDWFETVIDKSPTEYDSLMAVIDLGYTYLLMEENGIKNTPQCRYPQYIPESRHQYEISRDNLLTSLYTQSNVGLPGDQGTQSPVVNTPVLHANYPNPFNPSTTISFGLPSDMKCNLRIYNIRGQLVKTLVNGMLTSGTHYVVWDGKNDNNKSVGTGIYLYRLETKQSTQTHKMIMLK